MMRADLSGSYEVLRIGMITVVLVCVNAPFLAADGFNQGKFLVLSLTGALGIGILLTEGRGYSWEPSDWIPLAALLLGTLASLGGLRGWLSLVSSAAWVASVALFWTSRSISLSPGRAALVVTVAVALGLLVVSALIEAYTPLQFSIRPPGGTIGNRNRMAHLIVIGAPTLVLLTVRVCDRWMLGLLLAGSSLGGCALLLSRARGAWIAALAVVTAGVALVLLQRRRATEGSPPSSKTTRRLTLFAVASALGILAALVLPNQLDWVSDRPYRDSAARLLDYRSGTGAGRLTEYRNTLKMIADHPILGVGPGNWRIAYPNYATPGDPNIEPGYAPVRRFPQGEWIGIAAERGIPSLLLLLAFAGILAGRWLRAIAEERSHRKVGYAYVGLLTMVGVFMVGLFDPVLMTPTAGFVVPVILGVCAAPFARLRVWIPTPVVRRALIAVVIVGGTFLVSFPARELWAAMTYAKHPTLENFERATRISPGDYRAHFLAAAILVQRGDCTRAGPYIEAARRLYPTAPAAVELEVRCAEMLSQSADVEGVSPDADPPSGYQRVGQ